DHAAVARGVFHMRAHEDAGGTAFGLLRDQAAQRGGAQQGRIAVEHHQVAIQVRQGIAADHERVARALLFGLLDEADAGAGHGLAHLFGLVSDHGEDALRRRKIEGRVDDVLEKGLSAGAVQHLGLTALHAGAESGGQDHDGYGLFHYYHYAAGCPGVAGIPALRGLWVLTRFGNTTNGQHIPWGKPWDRQPVSGKLRRKLGVSPGFAAYLPSAPKKVKHLAFGPWSWTMVQIDYAGDRDFQVQGNVFGRSGGRSTDWSARSGHTIRTS